MKAFLSPIFSFEGTAGQLFRLPMGPIGIVLTTVLLGLASAGLETKVGCGTEPLYSRHAAIGGRLGSPDGKSVLVVKALHDRKDPDGYVSFSMMVGDRSLSTRLSGWRTEVLWSPDSKAFAVNQTEGGGGIGQRAYIFYAEKNGLRKVAVSPHIEKRVGTPVKCEVPVPLNTAIIRWLDHKRILVAAEVVPVSICKCSGMFQLYELSLPDFEVLHVYGQSESKRLFGDDLGCELRKADDSCANSWPK